MRGLLILALCALSVLACSGTLAHMQILDEPVYVCPTATPRPTDVPPPTDPAPPIHLPPSGWATLTPYPGCSWNGFVCATHAPPFGGIYTTPGQTIPGATSTPRPTTTPYPTPTSFVMRPPDTFYLGDPIYTGGFASSPNIRLRLLNLRAVGTAAGDPPRTIAAWDVEIINMGTTPYEVFPAWQSYVRAVATSAGYIAGGWGASGEAAAEAGLNEPYEAVTLAPGERRTFALAAYTPVGAPLRITFVLDPTTRTAPGMPGSNLLVWGNTTNPTCPDAVGDPGLMVIPTPRR